MGKARGTLALFTTRWNFSPGDTSAAAAAAVVFIISATGCSCQKRLLQVLFVSGTNEQTNN